MFAMVHTDGMLHAVDSTWLCLSLNKQLHVDVQETADEQADKFEKKRAKQLERDAVEARRANKRAAKQAKLDEQQKVQEKNKAEAEAGVQQDKEYAAFQAAAQPPQQQGKNKRKRGQQGREQDQSQQDQHDQLKQVDQPKQEPSKRAPKRRGQKKVQPDEPSAASAIATKTPEQATAAQPNKAEAAANARAEKAKIGLQKLLECKAKSGEPRDLRVPDENFARQCLSASC